MLVSLLTPAPAPESVDGLTWSHPLAAITQERFKGWRDPRLIAASPRRDGGGFVLHFPLRAKADRFRAVEVL